MADLVREIIKETYQNNEEFKKRLAALILGLDAGEKKTSSSRLQTK